jgi:hypothetical protein
MRWSRRRVLFGLGGAVVAAGGGAWALTHHGPPATGHSVLTPTEVATVRAIAEVWLPAGGVAVDGPPVDVAAGVDRVVAELMDDTRRAGFRAILRTLELGTIARQGASFSALDLDTRRTVLETWGDPRILPRRLATDALRGALGMAYFGDPRVLAAIGWSRGCGG